MLVQAGISKPGNGVTVTATPTDGPCHGMDSMHRTPMIGDEGVRVPQLKNRGAVATSNKDKDVVATLP